MGHFVKINVMAFDVAQRAFEPQSARIDLSVYISYKPIQ